MVFGFTCLHLYPSFLACSCACVDHMTCSDSSASTAAEEPTVVQERRRKWLGKEHPKKQGQQIKDKANFCQSSGLLWITTVLISLSTWWVGSMSPYRKADFELKTKCSYRTIVSTTLPKIGSEFQAMSISSWIANRCNSSAFRQVWISYWHVFHTAISLHLIPLVRQS